MDTYPVRSKNAIDDIVLTRYYAYLGVIWHASVAQFQNKYREKPVKRCRPGLIRLWLYLHMGWNAGYKTESCMKSLRHCKN